MPSADRTYCQTPGLSIIIASSHDIPTIIAEAKGQGHWTTQDVHWFTDGCLRVMITSAAKALNITGISKISLSLYCLRFIPSSFRPSCPIRSGPTNQ